MNKKRNIEFLFEIGTLRFIPRAWRQFLNKECANVAEHTFRVVWIALTIAIEEKADLNKVIKMSLVHDLPETRTGNVHYLSRQYTKRDNNMAINDTLMNTSVEREFLKLFHEYEERESLEAKIVKDADNLDADMEIEEHYANGVRSKEDFQPIRNRVSELLFTKTARKMWSEIQNSNHNDWHLNGNNRFKEGDWER